MPRKASIRICIAPSKDKTSSLLTLHFLTKFSCPEIRALVQKVDENESDALVTL